MSLHDPLTPTVVADMIASRRSIRSYASTPVTEGSIRSLLHAAVQAPTAMHAEPWLFTIVQDRSALKRYSDRAKSSLLEQQQPRLHDPVQTASSSTFLKALADPAFNIFYNAGAVILIGARLTSPFSTADCWLAAENLMLAAPALGLGTCCIGSALVVLNSPEIKAELTIPPDVTVVVAMTVGVPAETSPPSHRNPPVILSWKKG